MLQEEAHGGAMPGREGTRGAAQATLRFEDIIVYFSRSEWKSLAKWQKELYWEVLTDNYEALLVAGQPATRLEVMAWLQQCEHLIQESGVGDPAEIFPATSDRHSEACREERTGQVEFLEMLHDMPKEVVTQHGDMGAPPEHSPLLAQPQGNPARDEPLSRVEHRKSLAIPSCSQRRAVVPKPYKCKECGERLRLKGLLRMHQEIATRKMSLDCSICGLCFPSALCLRMHKRTHLSAKASPNRNRLSAQQGTYVPEKLHQCPDCGERFCGFLDVLEHQKSHEEAKHWPCTQCKASFGHRFDLVTHEEGHLEEALKEHNKRIWKCLCKPAFLLYCAALLGGGAQDSQDTSRDPEQPHQDGDAGGEAMPYLCAACGQLFKEEEDLEVHYRSCGKQWLQNAVSPIAPSGDHWEACDEQSFDQPDSVDGNGDMGLPNPPSQAASVRYSCPECGKLFASKASLRRHKRKHKAALQCRGSAAHVSGGGFGGPATARAAKKPYKCQECGKKLLHKWQVVAHQQGHAEGKSFICHRCGESFVSKIGFRKHRQGCVAGEAGGNSAPSEAKLVCQCGKTLSKLQFSRHQEFHAGLRYQCRLCGKVLSFESTAVSHCRIHVRKEQLPAGLSNSKLFADTIEKVYIPPEPQLPNPNYAFPAEQLLFWQGALEECEKGPRQKWQLKPPWVTLPKPYKCRDCGKDFAHLARLLSHHKEHEGDFPFQCAECGKAFISRNYLSLHWKTHIKESVQPSLEHDQLVPAGFSQSPLQSSSSTGAAGSPDGI